MTMPVMEPDLDATVLADRARAIDEGPFSSLCWGERIAFDNPESLTLLGAPAGWPSGPIATPSGQPVPRLPPGSPPAQPPPAQGPPPPIAAAEDEPPSGTYVGPDGHVYTQADLAQYAAEQRTWQSMPLPPPGN